MAEVSVTLNALVDTVRDTLKIETYLVDGMPATFELNKAYVLAPEEVNVEHYISSGSFQDFDVEIVIPVKQMDSGHQEILERSVMESLQNINTVLKDTFKRLKIIGTGHIYSSQYTITQWETNGFVYASADVTLSFKSFLDV